MTVQIVNLDAEHMYAILTMAVSDRVKIAHRHGRINAPFHIEAMHHDLSSGGGLHRLTLSCERVTDDIPARFGAAEFGTATFSE
jgi:hypothetical protein